MRNHVRALVVLLGFSFRAAPRQAALLFASQVAAQVADLGAVYGVKLVVDAIVRGDVDGAVVAGVSVALGEGIAYMCRRLFYLSREVEERAGLLIDQRLMALTTGIAGIAHHERPAFSDQVELLRARRGQLAALTGVVVGNLVSSLRLIGAAVLLSSISPWLLLLAPLGAASVLTGRWASAIQERAREANAERMRLRQSLFGLATSAAAGKELRVFELGEEIAARHRSVVTEMTREELRAAWKSRVVDLAGSVLFVAGFVAAVAFVLLRAIDGQATAGDVLLALRLTGELNSAIAALTGSATWLLQALTTAGRYLWLVNYAAETAAVPAEPAAVPDRLARGIALEHISFRYPGTDGQVPALIPAGPPRTSPRLAGARRPSPPGWRGGEVGGRPEGNMGPNTLAAPRLVLDDVSLFLPAGTVVALVGENGAGKTTLVKLLCRFYEPGAAAQAPDEPTGRILVDGVDLRSFDPGEWRRRISAGFQDFCRFELLARETVGVGELPHIASAAHVEAALARAGASDVPTSLPAGLETQLGKAWEGGVDLSGGQWQKLALARALMRWAPSGRPLLTVFDEPTAALDAETEHALFNRFAAAARSADRGGAVTILVSHRFSTVRMADLIVVLEQGRIAEHGTHGELLQRDGSYARLYRLQARAYAQPGQGNAVRCSTHTDRAL